MSVHQILSCVAVAVLGALAGCSGHGHPGKQTQLPLRVVCTTTILADLVGMVGGDRVAVTTLMPPSVDPHKYIPKLDDRRKLDDAQIIFFNGLHLEGKMTDLFVRNQGRWRAWGVADSLPRVQLRPADDANGEFDPHVWFDVHLWRAVVPFIGERLAEIDPLGSTFYQTRAAEYSCQLEKLDSDIREILAVVPPERRVLVTAHDAFGYFGRAYNFEVIGLQGVSTASEVGTARRAELARILGERRIPAVFAETSVPDEGLRAVLDDVRTKYRHEVRLIGGRDALYSDSLGEPGSPGETYVGMIRHNAAVIAAALSGRPVASTPR